MTGANMENKLALVWRENVIRLMEHFNLSNMDMCNLTGRSTSTIQSNFGGKVMGAPSSKQTMVAIERAFKLNQGSLSKPGWSPASEPLMEHPEKAPAEQLATLNLPIPAHKLERIMRILLDDD